MTEDDFRANADLALKTRDLPFAQQVSKSMFFSYVLPYSHFDEPIDDWRSRMYPKLLPYVKDKQSLKDAAEAIMPIWGTALGKLEFKSNMTPQVMAPITETLQKGYASCTGMSIFLADCMRAVGIPARIVGVNEWNRPEGGNHNWVEIWVGDRWNFVDAVPSSQAVTWNQTWFNEQATKQSSEPKSYAILSPLWGPEADTVYPMTWRTPPTYVSAIDVTANYASPAAASRSLVAPLGFASSSIGVILPLAAIAILGFAFHIYKQRKESGYERLP